MAQTSAEKMRAWSNEGSPAQWSLSDSKDSDFVIISEIGLRCRDESGWCLVDGEEHFLAGEQHLQLSDVSDDLLCDALGEEEEEEDGGKGGNDNDGKEEEEEEEEEEKEEDEPIIPIRLEPVDQKLETEISDEDLLQNVFLEERLDAEERDAGEGDEQEDDCRDEEEDDVGDSLLFDFSVNEGYSGRLKHSFLGGRIRRKSGRRAALQWL
ncbi:nuclear polyadenylated RNA-binding protein 3-like [Penaeus japonicus]|uniref:nuclear polyadenylated RNA-binding protein 3-like n=1 Tax=Penaeus japonicus TaxID=27405 RepID=UPI001C714F37|nr:nuclear polyadenylated RNA-binding protein 3-like [Penaeus japonicus]